MHWQLLLPVLNKDVCEIESFLRRKWVCCLSFVEKQAFFLACDWQYRMLQNFLLVRFHERLKSIFDFLPINFCANTSILSMNYNITSFFILWIEIIQEVHKNNIWISIGNSKTLHCIGGFRILTIVKGKMHWINAIIVFHSAFVISFASRGNNLFLSYYFYSFERLKTNKHLL